MWAVTLFKFVLILTTGATWYYTYLAIKDARTKDTWKGSDLGGYLFFGAIANILAVIVVSLLMMFLFSILDVMLY
ncbi:hypothetical protein HSE3_gp040 [Bacillus phage vB_BceM-HSE3]|nr:hypothetical protein HSE3_gp040 [Bacillus phage vB_BceM-HSE3]